MQKFTPESYEEFLKTFKLNVPKNYNFAYDTFDAIAAEHPDQAALVHVGPDEVQRTYSFDWLRRASNRMANALAAAGMKKGDRIMLILYRRVDFWVSMLALHRLGAVAVPSPNLLTVKDITYRVQTGKIKGAIAEDSVAATVEAARAACPGFDMLVQAGPSPIMPGWLSYDALFHSGASEDFPRTKQTPGGSEPLLIFFTSGTTGQPKMVLHDHTYPLGHYVTGVYWHNLEPGDVHLTVADTGWGKAVWGKMYGQWMARASVFVYDFRGKFSPADLLRVVSRCKVTSFCAPPTVYRFLVREELAKYDLSALRHCTTAGELLNDTVFDAWLKATGLTIYEGYGQTETTLQVATFPFMEAKAGSIGKPTPGWDIDLLDAQGNVVPVGDEGEICIRLDKPPVGLFVEYLDEPEKTASVRFDNYYHTGDKAWRDEDGYIWFLGRVDDLIKSSGYRIGPFEVESALVGHPAVVEAAVTGVPDDVRGQAVKATVVLAPGFTASDGLTKELQNHVKSVTAPYKYPRIIEYVPELPKTISGKIKRAEIRQRDEDKTTC
ncbi:MAG: AMP-binding protein [Desulfovibrionaceae bacterium]